MASDDPWAQAVQALTSDETSAASIVRGLTLRSPLEGDGDAPRLLGLAAFALGDHESALRFRTVAAEDWRARGRRRSARPGPHDPRLDGAAPRARRDRGAGLRGGTDALAIAPASSSTPPCRPQARRWSRPCAETSRRRPGSPPRPNGSPFLHAMAATAFDALHARAMAALAGGRQDDAFDALLRLTRTDDLACTASSGGGSSETSPRRRSSLDARTRSPTSWRNVERVADRTQSPKVAVAVSYARAVLSDDEMCLRDAIRVSGKAWPFTTARAQLAYGGWLRRSRRTVEARSPLAAAELAFEALGTTPWAQRAQLELRLAGGSDPAVDGDELTPHELQIARLVAAGCQPRDRAATPGLPPHDRFPSLPDLSQARGFVANPDPRGARASARDHAVDRPVLGRWPSLTASRPATQSGDAAGGAEASSSCGSRARKARIGWCG